MATPKQARGCNGIHDKGSDDIHDNGRDGFGDLLLFGQATGFMVSVLCVMVVH